MADIDKKENEDLGILYTKFIKDFFEVNEEELNNIVLPEKIIRLMAHMSYQSFLFGWHKSKEYNETKNAFKSIKDFEASEDATKELIQKLMKGG